ncbi:condensation domain-containing protein [Streptomyces sp. H27-S2]|uniref:condensation domain-containing protein n=1 Tax=Streptomyces antarcticus TaxID=2996458 RepID=UPI002271F137|nr:condensation domain-containing protein [Streptomyces sp. H27-S2]MCY0950424.1 condensation domain-containing protein [Streptomyces sp. H27-S2]
MTQTVTPEGTPQDPATTGQDLPSAESIRLIERQVESVLLEHPDVLDAAVVFRGGTLEDAPAEICVRCGMDGRYPGLDLDAGTGVCGLCTMYEEHRDEIHGYFGDTEAFAARIRERAAAAGSDYDCLLLFSGGKDSTYVLHQLVRLGLRVMTFTFDNGFISKTALENVETVTAALGIDHVTKTRADQNRVFVQSLKEHKSVCNGCFRSLLDLANQLAYDRGIPSIVTGLSRGQIIDERLLWFYRQGDFDAERIEKQLAVGRQVYHRVGDRTDSGSDRAVDEVEVVDYFRYSEVTKDGIRALLAATSEMWSAPKDTGFCSSNCMINDVGVYVHKLERGFHNYESPTRWEVRLGHLARAEADAELRTPVNIHRVKSMLARIGYTDPGTREALGSRLAAYFVVREGATADESELRAAAAARLPEFLHPEHWVRLDEVPRSRGVVTRRALPDPLDGAGKRLQLSAHGSAALVGGDDGDGTTPVTAAQQALLESGRAGARALLLDLDTRPALVDVRRAVLAVVLHHEALRSRFALRASDGMWRRGTAPAAPAAPVAAVDLTRRAEQDEPALLRALERKLRARLDPAAGVLAQVVLVERGERPARLLLVVHELAADTAGWRVLLDDLATALTQVRAGTPVSLPPAAAPERPAGGTAAAAIAAADTAAAIAAGAGAAADGHTALPPAAGTPARHDGGSLSPAHSRALAAAPGGAAAAVAAGLRDVLGAAFGGTALSLAVADHTATAGRPARLVAAATAARTVTLPAAAAGPGRAAVGLTHLGDAAVEPEGGPFRAAGIPGLRLEAVPAVGHHPLEVVLQERDGALSVDWWSAEPLHGELTGSGTPQQLVEWLTSHAQNMQEHTP